MENEGLLPTGPMILPPGSRVGRCKIERLIATGGQGSVYVARHEALDRDVAVKVLATSLATDPDFVRRFVREARAAAKLDHPNIVQVHDAGSEGGLHYIVMQYVDGRDLDAILEKKGRTSVGDALSIGKRVALALGTAHKAGIVHRDVKPSNIMITRQGKVLIMDFGLARDVTATVSGSITQGDFVMGTPDFLSPEQAMGERADARSDIYSLGATLYRMLAGQPPYPDGDAMTVMTKHARENEHPAPLRSLNPEVPEALEKLISKMMAKNPADRCRSMDEVVAAIDEIKGERGTRRAEAVLPERRRTRFALAAGIGIAIAAIAILIVLFIALLRSSGAEQALQAARRMDQLAQKEPSRLPLAISLYRSVTEAYPNSKQWRAAAERLAILEPLQAEREKIRKRLAEIESTARTGSFAACAPDIRRLLQEKPPADLEKRAKDLLETAARWEIEHRALKAIELALDRKMDALLTLIDPADRKGNVRDQLRFIIWLTEAPAGFDRNNLDVRPLPDRLVLDMDNGRAELTVAVTVRKRTGGENTTEHLWRWKLIGDVWYLDLKE